MNLEPKRENGKIYVPLKDKWLIETPEELVRQKYILKLVHVYGYSLKQMAQELQVTNSSRGQGRARADIVVWKSEEDKLNSKRAFIVVECKAENIKIREEDYFQGFNYASWAGSTFFVTTNEKEIKYFNVDKDYLPKKLEEIIDIPNASMVNDEKKIKELLSATKRFERGEFANLLFKCHNIIRNNDRLSPEAAFDEISKILFMKIRYERNPSEESIFSKKKFLRDEKVFEETTRPTLRGTPYDKPYMQYLFDTTKRLFEKDNLFENNEEIKIKRVSFESIVEQLEKYNLSDTSDDIKGIAFEEFLGKTFRGELGQFFTPRTVVEFMVEILDPKESEIICDPCAGSGGFLIKVFEYIREKIEKDIQETKEKIKQEYFTKEFECLSEEEQEIITQKVNRLFAQLNEELNNMNKKSRMYRLSHENIYGTDANPRMARTSKMNMIMHGDGHTGVYHHDGLLDINGMFENHFDVILTNPPFGSRVERTLKVTESDICIDNNTIELYTKKYGKPYTDAFKKMKDNIGKTVLSLYDLGQICGLTEVLFMERCLKLLKPGGRLGIVLPEGVLNTSNLQKVREYFEARAKIVLITSIPQDVFVASGAKVKPSLVFLKKFTEEESKKYQDTLQTVTEKVNEKYEPEKIRINRPYEEENERLTIVKENIKDLRKQFKKDKNDKIKMLIENKLEEEKQLKQNLKIIKSKLTVKLKEIDTKMEDEIKAKVKEGLDYEIAISEVDKAGIDSKGDKCENKLIPLVKEFKSYRINQNLWEEKNNSIKYEIIDEYIYRTKNSNTPEVFYEK